jgi:putative spermidine/putrescine transport system substrate-binding protein
MVTLFNSTQSILQKRMADLSMINRRSFLIGTTGLTLSHLLTGCAGQNRPTLNVRMLNGSIPPQILNLFHRHLQQSSKQATLNFSPELQLQSLFSSLQSWKQQTNQPQSPEGIFDWVPFPGKSQQQTIPDLVSLGDYWLSTAIRQGLIQSFEQTQLKNWDGLMEDSRWKTLVTRNQSGEPDPEGKIWAVPYRWGSTLIAYRRDIFRDRGLQPPTDWGDLWRPELRRQISLLDQPREVIGLTLKKLGKSYNTSDLNAVPNLQAELDALQSQVKLYSSDHYLQPLILGDTWLAVGWSADVLRLMQRNQTVDAIVPQSGTALWADLWVRPAASKTDDLSLVMDWIKFCWQPPIATQLSMLSQAASPIFLQENPNHLPENLRANPLLLPDQQILKASEFLNPLPEAAIKDYQERWKRLRQ